MTKRILVGEVISYPRVTYAEHVVQKPDGLDWIRNLPFVGAFVPKNNGFAVRFPAHAGVGPAQFRPMPGITYLKGGRFEDYLDAYGNTWVEPWVSDVLEWGLLEISIDRLIAYAGEAE